MNALATTPAHAADEYAPAGLLVEQYRRLTEEVAGEMCRRDTVPHSAGSPCLYHVRRAGYEASLVLAEIGRAGYVLVRTRGDVSGELDKLREVAPALVNPHREDQMEGWLKWWRDNHGQGSDAWCALDGLLDAYREMADTGKSPAEMVKAAQEEAGEPEQATIKLVLVRYEGEEDDDMVRNLLQEYGLIELGITGTSVGVDPDSGHPLVKFTGEPEAIERLRIRYSAEDGWEEKEEPVGGKD